MQRTKNNYLKFESQLQKKKKIEMDNFTIRNTMFVQDQKYAHCAL